MRPAKAPAPRKGKAVATEKKYQFAVTAFVDGSRGKYTVHETKEAAEKQARRWAPEYQARAEMIGNEDRMLAAAKSLGGGKTRQRIRLADLRAALRSMPRDEFNRVALKLQADEKVVLYRQDNSAEITEDDASAAIMIAGNPRHLLYVE